MNDYLIAIEIDASGETNIEAAGNGLDLILDLAGRALRGIDYITVKVDDDEVYLIQEHGEWRQATEKEMGVLD